MSAKGEIKFFAAFAPFCSKNKKGATGKPSRPFFKEFYRLVVRDGSFHVHAATIAIKCYVSVHQGENRVVTAEADVATRLELGSTLANDDVTRDDGLTAKFFDAQPFAVAVAAVLNTSLSFFMGHKPE